jgi:hypothetical protein
VVYVRLLLAIQACLWAMVDLLAAVILLMSVVGGDLAPHAGAFIGLCIIVLQFMLAMSAGSAYLAASLQPGRASIRRTAIAVEAFMACFGLFIAYVEASTGAGIIAGLPASAGLVGTMLSLAAVVGLLCGPARSFGGRNGDGPALSPG